MDTFITALLAVGICLGVASMFRRQQKALRYGFYAAILGASSLRIVRAVGRGEAAAASDILVLAFLVTAILGDLLAARRSAKR